MPTTLPKEAFLALVALSHADGSVRPIEKAGLLRAAEACGVGQDGRGDIEAALATSATLDSFVPGEMTDWQRALTYALACWLMRLDGVLSTDERESLAQLGKRLDLDEGTRQRASAAAFDVYVLPEAGRPERFDFVKLEERLREKLPRFKDA
ncbi:MAG: hypothetical protein U0271_35435 [Polyangiaceae bacterium]